jgi:hypothetical protein
MGTLEGHQSMLVKKLLTFFFFTHILKPVTSQTKKTALFLELFLHAECYFNMYECNNQFREGYSHTHTCQHHTLRVEITLVRVEITLCE